jgi:hypothetical protein
MIIGHPKHTASLERLRSDEALPHAFLFSGPKGVGKGSFGEALAQWLQCEDGVALTRIGECSCAACAHSEITAHPDVMVTEGALTIAGARAISKRTHRTPFLGRYTVVIIPSAELMKQEAATALLKVLEEPKSNTVFILLTEQPQAVLPTIASRCYQMKFHYVADSLIARTLNTKAIGALQPYWSGRPAFAARLLSDAAYRKRIEGHTKDCAIFLAGTLYHRFKMVERYAKHDRLQLREMLEVWLAYIRTQVPDAARYGLLRYVLRMYRVLTTTNASAELLMSSFAVNTPRVRTQAAA